MTATIPWQPPPEKLCLHKNEIHIWKINLLQPAAVTGALYELLSEDEKDRANRFHFPKDRDKYIVGRAAMRIILSRYIAENPGALVFYYGLQGKPFLSDELNKPQIRFNLSHSHQLALLGVALQQEIGVDIEYIRPEFGGEDIAKRFFAPGEVNRLFKLPQSQQKQAFFNCWTRKEAFIKARGEGLSCPLDQFEVALEPGKPARLLQTQWDPQEAAQWTMQEIYIEGNYRAAVAVKGSLENLSHWNWGVEF